MASVTRFAETVLNKAKSLVLPTGELALKFLWRCSPAAEHTQYHVNCSQFRCDATEKNEEVGGRNVGHRL